MITLPEFCVMLLCAVAVIEVLVYLDYRKDRIGIIGLYCVHAVTTLAWLALIAFAIMANSQLQVWKTAWIVLFLPTFFTSMLTALFIVAPISTSAERS